MTKNGKQKRFFTKNENRLLNKRSKRFRNNLQNHFRIFQRKNKYNQTIVSIITKDFNNYLYNKILSNRVTFIIYRYDFQKPILQGFEKNNKKPDLHIKTICKFEQFCNPNNQNKRMSFRILTKKSQICRNLQMQIQQNQPKMQTNDIFDCYKLSYKIDGFKRFIY